MRALFAASCLLVSSVGYAQQCPAPTFVYEPGSAVVQGPNAPVEALADSVRTENGVVSLDGNTSISYQGRTITAENAVYDTNTGEVQVNGDMRIEAEGFLIESTIGDIDLDDNRFSTGESVYEVDQNGNRANGKAEGIERRADGSLIMKGATYTTCPIMDNSWFIKANRIELYPDDGLGIAKNIVLRFKGAPIFAFPIFSFPISPDRRTGFLGPSLGQSENTGTEFQIPFYWNIRPNLDATLTPRFMSLRGLQLQTEVRYLNQQGAWRLENEILSDRTFPGRQRRFTQLQHDGTLGVLWQTHINASQVSDDDYFEDLGNSLQANSISHLEQKAELLYDFQGTQVELRVQGFQTVDQSIPSDERPYQRLPQMQFNTEVARRPLGIRASFESEAVFFDRSDSLTGIRVDATPRLSLPISTSAWFLKPSISHRFTFYDLNNTEDGQSDNLNRNITTVSVDGGLFFDRLLDQDGSVLTLEPRLFYLRVPFVDQSDVPVFDSNEFDFNIAQLFRENRFTGADRVADANQLSVALTSRMIDGNNGNETWRGSIGQIFYFEDRLVSLDSEEPDTSSTSDFVGELSRQFPNDWNVKGNIQYSTSDDRTVRSSLLVSYRPEENKILNFGHRQVSNGTSADTEQLDFSMLWPIADQWRLAARWNYSLADDTDIESLIGLQYDSCCWALRFAARRFISDDGLDHDNSLYLQLVLKGLAPLGQDYGDLLEFSILGYRDELK